MTPAGIFDRCVYEAERVNDIEGFKDWTRGAVRMLLPHGALACGHGRIHSAGVAMDYVVTVDYPTEHLRAIRNPSGAIDTPLMRRWLMQRTPIFFEAETPWSGIDDRWLADFRHHRLVNTAADAVFDETECIGTYFSFHRLPDLNLVAQSGVFKSLTPLLHATLMRAVRAHQIHRNAVIASESRLTEPEKQIASWISRGKSNVQIATLLGLSENTVKHKISRILDKTGCSNRAGLATLVVTQQQTALGGTNVL